MPQMSCWFSGNPEMLQMSRLSLGAMRKAFLPCPCSACAGLLGPAAAPAGTDRAGMGRDGKGRRIRNVSGMRGLGKSQVWLLGAGVVADVLGCGRWSRGFGVFGELKGAGLGNVSGSRAGAALVPVSVCSG